MLIRPAPAPGGFGDHRSPLMVRLIAASRVRTDESSTLKLARLLAAGLIPAVWVPPQEVRELRTLVAHRQRLIRQRTQARNRLHSLLQRNNLVIDNVPQMCYP